MREPSYLSNASRIEADRKQEQNRTSDKTRDRVPRIPMSTYQPTVKQQIFAAGVATLCLFALVVEATNKDKPKSNGEFTKNKSRTKNNQESQYFEKAGNTTSIRTQNYNKNSFFPMRETVSKTLPLIVNNNQTCSERHSQKLTTNMTSQDLYKDLREFIDRLQEKLDNGIDLQSLRFLINQFKNHCRASRLPLSNVIISHFDKLVLPGAIKENKIHTVGEVWIELDGRISITPPCNGVLGYLAITRPFIMSPDLFTSDANEDEVIIRLTKFFEKTQDRKYIASYTENYARMMIEKVDIIEKLFTAVLFHHQHPELKLLKDINELEDLYIDKLLRIDRFKIIVKHCSEKKIDEPSVLYFHEVYEKNLIPLQYRDKLVELLRNDFLGCIGEGGFAIELFEAFVKLYSKEGLDEETKQHIIRWKEYKSNRSLTESEMQDYSSMRTEVTEVMALSIRNMFEERGKEVLSQLRVYDEHGKNLYVSKIKTLISQATSNSEVKKFITNKIRSLIKTMKQDSFISPIVDAFFMIEEFEILATEQSHIGDFRQIEQYEYTSGLYDSSRRIYVSLSNKFPDNILSYNDKLHSKIAILAEEMTHAIDRYFHFSDSEKFKEIYSLDLEWVETIWDIFHEVLIKKNLKRLAKKYQTIFYEIMDLLGEHIGDKKEAIKYIDVMLHDAYRHTIRAYGDYRAEYLAKIQAFKTKWGDDLTNYLFPGAIKFYHQIVIPVCNDFVIENFTNQLNDIKSAMTHHQNIQEPVQTSNANFLRPFFKINKT